MTTYEKYKIKAYNMKVYNSTIMKMKNEKYSMSVYALHERRHDIGTGEEMIYVIIHRM